MAIFRVNKSKDYTTMSNYHLKDKKLSLKAKGLLSVMLSLPDDWNYSIEGLVKICKESEDAIESALKELKKNHYLVVYKMMPNETESGRYEYIYDIYEKPKQEGEKQGLEFQGLEKQEVELQEVENPGLYKYTNNKILNNKILNNKELIYYEDRKLNDIFLDFLEVRKKIKAVNSERAINSLLNKLSKYDDSTKYKMIDKSIRNSWKDVYELKKEEIEKEVPYWMNNQKEENDEPGEDDEEMRRLIEEIEGTRNNSG